MHSPLMNLRALRNRAASVASLLRDLEHAHASDHLADLDADVEGARQLEGCMHVNMEGVAQRDGEA